MPPPAALASVPLLPSTPCDDPGLTTVSGVFPQVVPMPGVEGTGDTLTTTPLNVNQMVAPITLSGFSLSPAAEPFP